VAIQGEQIGNAVLVLTTDAKGLEQGLRDAEQKTRTGVQKLQQIGAGLTKMGKTLTVGVTAPLVALGVMMVKAAAEQEEAEARMQRAIEATGRVGEMSLEQLTRFTSEMQKQSLYGDEQILDAMSHLQTLANLDQETLQTVTRGAMNIAAALDKDLVSVMDAIGKTLAGGRSSVAEFGIVLDQNLGPHEKIESLIEQLGRFEGAAEDVAAVGTGPLTQLKMSLGDLGEKFGEVILPHLTKVVEKLQKVVEWLDKLDPKTREFIVLAAGIAAAVGPALLVIGGLFTALAGVGKVLAPLIGAAGSLAGLGTAAGGAVAGVSSLLGPIVAIGAAGTAAAVGIALLITKLQEHNKDFGGATEQMRRYGVEAGKTEEAAAELEARIEDIARSDAAEEGARKLVAAYGLTLPAFNEIKDELVGHSIIPDMVDDILSEFDRLTAGIERRTGEAADAMSGLGGPGESILEAGRGSGGLERAARINAREARGGEGLAAIGDALGSAIGRVVQWFSNLIMASQPITDLLDRFSAALAPIIDMIAGPLVTAITPLVDLLLSLVAQIAGPVMGMFEMLGLFLQQTMPVWEALGTIIVRIVDLLATALAPVFAALVPILLALTPVFDAIGQILDALQPVFRGVGLIVAGVGAVFGWLIQKLVALGTTIWYIVSLQWGKLGTVDWGGTLGEALAAATANLGQYQEYAPEGGGGLDLGGGGAGGGALGGGAAGYGGGATYQQARPINVIVQILNPQVYGGNIRDFAIIIRNELESLDVLGL
jgi:phage-related protein